MGNSSTSSRQNVAFFWCDRTSTPTASRTHTRRAHARHRVGADACAAGVETQPRNTPSGSGVTHLSPRRCTGPGPQATFSACSSNCTRRLRLTAVTGQGPTNGVEACALALRRWIARANASMDPTHGGRVKNLDRVVRVDGTLRSIVLASPIVRIILRIGCAVGHPCLDAS